MIIKNIIKTEAENKNIEKYRVKLMIFIETQKIL
jgi:hypothetical protein